MTIALFKLPVDQPRRFQAILDWLRHANAALAPVRDEDRLGDRLLADIDAERPHIARAIDQDVGRMGLLDLGWQQPRRPNRR